MIRAKKGNKVMEKRGMQQLWIKNEFSGFEKRKPGDYNSLGEEGGGRRCSIKGRQGWDRSWDSV